MDTEVLLTYMIMVLSKTAYHEEIQHSYAVQLPRYKEGIWGGIFSLSFRCLQLNLFLWAPFAAEEKLSFLGHRSSGLGVEV